LGIQTRKTPAIDWLTNDHSIQNHAEKAGVKRRMLPLRKRKNESGCGSTFSLSAEDAEKVKVLLRIWRRKATGLTDQLRINPCIVTTRI